MMKDNISLNELIERYFNAETTLEEESLLRNMLAKSSDRSAEVEEARAVMSYLAMTPAKRSTEKRLKPQRRKGLRYAVAAAVAMAVLIGSVALWLPSMDFDGGGSKRLAMANRPDTRRIAMIGSGEYQRAHATVGGKVVDDVADIESMVISQLNEISAASGSLQKAVDDEISTISQLFNQQ